MGLAEIIPISYTLAERKKEEGITRAEQAAKEELKAGFRQAMRDIYRWNKDFSTDDVWLYMLRRGWKLPKEKRWCAGIIRTMIRDGEITIVGEKYSEWHANHKRKISVYRMVK